MKRAEIALRTRCVAVGWLVGVGFWIACLLFQHPPSHFAILFWPVGIFGGMMVYLLKRGRSHA